MNQTREFRVGSHVCVVLFIYYCLVVLSTYRYILSQCF